MELIHFAIRHREDSTEYHIVLYENIKLPIIKNDKLKKIIYQKMQNYFNKKDLSCISDDNLIKELEKRGYQIIKIDNDRSIFRNIEMD